jgi:hypothetical protein
MNTETFSIRRLSAAAYASLARDLGDQPGILLQAEPEVYAVRLAPGHRGLSTAFAAAPAGCHYGGLCGLRSGLPDRRFVRPGW